MLPGAASRCESIQTAWLHRVNGFWERGRQPGVIHRHDLIEWNTIHPMWHPESVLRTIFLDVMMSGNARRTPIFELRQERLNLYEGQFFLASDGKEWKKRAIKDNYQNAVIQPTSSHTSRAAATLGSSSGSIPPPGTIHLSGCRLLLTSNT